MMVSSNIVILAEAGIEGAHNYLKNWIPAREFYSILVILILLLTGCSSRLGKENVSVLGFSSSPAPNSSKVPINATVKIFFNTLLDPATLNSDLFILMDSSGHAVPIKMDYAPLPDSGTSVLTLTPVGYLQSPPVYLNINSVYTVTIGGGIKTLAGDAMTPLAVWSFATNNSTDITPPTFGGAISAEGLDMGSIRLAWGPAVDNSGGTPSNNLSFGICYSLSPTACTTRFVPLYINPSATIDSNGNFNFILKNLKPETLYYIMVRVIDMAGNQDSNAIQVTASTKGGKLYVSNFNANEILGFDHPSQLNRSTSQVRSIKASQNGLIDPYGMFYDRMNNRLYISTCQPTTSFSLIESLVQPFCAPGSSKIAIYDNTTTLPGRDQVPDRTIIGTGLNGPIGVFLDNSAGKDTLYVANYVGKSVAVYDNVTSSCNAYISANSTAGTCTITPRVSFNSPDLSTPFGIAFDFQRQYLYVSNYIQCFQCPDSSGNLQSAIPGTTLAVFAANQLIPHSGIVTISSSKTISGFNSPAGLWMDIPNDTLYVANPGASLAPSGGTLYPGIAAICNISLIPPGAQSIPGFSSCTTSTSQPQAAAQYLAGSSTGFFWPVQMAISYASNSSTPSLYVSDFTRNTVDVFSPSPFFSTSSVYYNTPPNEMLLGLNNNEIKKTVGITVSNDASGNDNLYVASLGWDEILLFDQVGLNYPCSGTTPPFQCNFPSSRKISSSISGPAGIFLNDTSSVNGIPKDRIYVSNFSNNSIVILDGASALNGNAYNAIYKTITSSKLQDPFGIYVDTSQSREWVYVVNSRKDSTGAFAVVVFDLSLCALYQPNNTSCNFDAMPGSVQPQPRVIHSADFSSPAGIWVDEAVDSNNQPRDILFVSNRGTSSASSPGFITMFNNSSTLSGSYPASKIIEGNLTSLFIPTGLLMDPNKDQLYIANQGYNDILVFNQPQNCTASQGTNLCNALPDRIIYNTSDINHILDGPSSLVVDFSADQIYLSNLGLYSHLPSLLVIDQASTINGQAFISNSLVANGANLSTFILKFPESLALDITR